MAKLYISDPDACALQCVSVVDPQAHKRSSILRLRLDLANYNPGGFGWGYEGDGSAQLAVAILADATGSDETARRLHQDYMREVIAKLDMTKRWTIRWLAVLQWVQKHTEAEAAQAAAVAALWRRRLDAAQGVLHTSTPT